MPKWYGLQGLIIIIIIMLRVGSAVGSVLASAMGVA
jgi:hypothetical protein